MMVVGFLVPLIVKADYNSSSAEGLLSGLKAQPATSSSASASASTASLDDLLAKAKNYLKLSAKEEKWNKELGEARAAYDAEKKKKLQMAAIERELHDARTKDNQAGLKQVAGIPTNTPGLVAKDVDTSSSEGACKADNTNVKQFADFLLSAPVKKLQAEAPSFLEKKKEEKELELANMAQLAEQFQRALDKKDDSLDGKDAASAIIAKFGLQSVPEEIRGQRAKEKKEWYDKAALEEKKSFITEMMKPDGFIARMLKITANDKGVLALSAGVRDLMEGYRKQTYEAQIKLAKEETAACKKNKTALGSNVLAPNTLFNGAYQALVNYHGGNAGFFANTAFFQIASKKVNAVKCPDVAADIEKQMGKNSTFAQEIQSLGKEVNLKKLLRKTSDILPLAGASLKASGESIRTAITACERSEKTKKEFTEYKASLDASVGQQGLAAQEGAAQDGSAPAPRGAARPGDAFAQVPATPGFPGHSFPVTR